MAGSSSYVISAKHMKWIYVTQLQLIIPNRSHVLSMVVSNYNTCSTQKKARFDTKMPGSTQKCPTQHASIDIAIIKHPPPFYWNYFLFFFVLKNPYINLKKNLCQNGEAADPLVVRVSQCTVQELRNSS